MLKVLEYATTQIKLKQVIFFLDYTASSDNQGVNGFNPSDWNSDFISTFKSHALAYLSYNAVNGIFKNIIANIIPLKGTTKYGDIIYPIKTRFSDTPLEERIQLMQRSESAIVDYSISLEYISRINQICIENNIKLTVILAPFPPSHIQVRKNNSTWDSVNEWKNELGNIVHYYDFYEENDFITAKDFYDNVHFTPSIGKKILSEIK
jgi:hypothetical protein